MAKHPPTVNATFCTHCGRPVPAAAQFCPSCGATAASGPGIGATGPAGWAAPAMVLATGPAFNPERDRRALRWVVWSAIVGLAAAVVSVGTTVLNALLPFVHTTTTASGTTFSVQGAFVWWALIAVDAGLAVVWIALMRSAFGTLAPIDRRFSAPATLAWVAIAGILLAVIGIALLFRSLEGAAGCSGTGNSTLANCLLGSGLIAALGVVGIGGVLALVGYIGVLVGVWRLGRRYDDDGFRIGAVLYLFPVLNLVGQILILVSARKGTTRFGGTPSPTGITP